MRLSLKSTAAALVLATSASLTLTACGSDDPGTGDTSAVGQDAGTELTQENFFTEVAAASAEAGTAHVDMDFGVSGQAIKAAGDLVSGESPEQTRMQMTMSMGEMDSIELRLVEGVLYMNMGPMSENKFLRIDLGDEGGPMAGQFDDLLDNLDPAAQLEQLQSAITSFEQTGEPEQLDGVEATPYRIGIDAAQVAEQLGDPEEAAGLPEEIVYTMYVGPDNLPRRLVMDLQGAEMTMDYTDWGKDVEIEAPAEDQISDMDPGMLGMAGAA